MLRFTTYRTFKSIFESNERQLSYLILGYDDDPKNYPTLTEKRDVALILSYNKGDLDEEDAQYVENPNFDAALDKNPSTAQELKDLIDQITEKKKRKSKKKENLNIKEEVEYSFSWRAVLDAWKSGDYLKNPTDLNGFEWRTLPVNFDASSEYKQIFIPSTFPDTPDNETFSKYFTSSFDKTGKLPAGIVIWNKNHDTKMVIPNLNYSKTSKSKNFSHLANFMLEADEEQQREFWKIVADAIEEELELLVNNQQNEGNKLYVSTHGHGVNYLHVRIEHDRPKYFDPEKLNVKKMTHYNF